MLFRSFRALFARPAMVSARTDQIMIYFILGSKRKQPVFPAATKYSRRNYHDNPKFSGQIMAQTRGLSGYGYSETRPDPDFGPIVSIRLEYSRSPEPIRRSGRPQVFDECLPKCPAKSHQERCRMAEIAHAGVGPRYDQAPANAVRNFKSKSGTSRCFRYARAVRQWSRSARSHAEAAPRWNRPHRAYRPCRRPRLT